MSLSEDARCVAFNHIDVLPCKTGFVSPDGEHIHWDLAYVFDWYRLETGTKMKAYAFYANVKEQLEKRFDAIMLAQHLSLRGVEARSGIKTYVILGLCHKQQFYVFKAFFRFSLVIWKQMGWLWIAFACRPQILWRNLITTMALLAFLVDLTDTCRAQAHCNFLVGTLKGIVFLVLPVLSSCPDQHLAVPGIASCLQLNPSGQVSFEVFLSAVHKGTLASWRQCWDEMHVSGLLASVWEEQVSLTDLTIFLTLLNRFRRNKRKQAMQTSAYNLMRKLQDVLLSTIASLLDEHLLSLTNVEEVPPARKFRTERVSKVW